MDRMSKRLSLRPQEEFNKDWNKVKKYLEINWTFKNWYKTFE